MRAPSSRSQSSRGYSPAPLRFAELTIAQYRTCQPRYVEHLTKARDARCTGSGEAAGVAANYDPTATGEITIAAILRAKIAPRLMFDQHQNGGRRKRPNASGPHDSQDQPDAALAECD